MDARHTAEILRRLITKSFIIRFLTRTHTWLYRVSGGRIGGKVADLPVLLLTTRGRKTGLRRTTPLCYLPVATENGRDCRYAIVGSFGGSPKPPAWYLNLQATSVAEIQIKSRRYSVVSNDAEGPEAARLWQDFCECYPGYEVYQAATDRAIPIVLLEPY